MAEAWTHVLHPATCEASSAGITTHGLDAAAVSVMAEEGVDIRRHVSKPITQLRSIDFDCVITLSEQARIKLPAPWRSMNVRHAGFDSPRQKEVGRMKRVPDLIEYRRVRDEIRAYVESLDILTIPSIYPQQAVSM